MDIEKDILLSIDMDKDLMVPWYFIVKYAEEKNERLVSNSFCEHLKQKIDINRDELNHRYIPYLEKENEYPPGIDVALMEVQRIYE